MENCNARELSTRACVYVVYPRVCKVLDLAWKISKIANKVPELVYSIPRVCKVPKLEGKF